MPSITITGYSDPCISFELDPPYIAGTVSVETSTDGGATWGGNFYGSPTSPRCGYSFDETTQFRLRWFKPGDGEYVSNVWGVVIPDPNDVPRTAIENESQITFVNSPVHCRIQNAAMNDTIRNVELKLWVWNGDLGRELGYPNVTWKKDQVSALDNYINIEISDQLKSYIEVPAFNSTAPQPGFAYNVNELPAVSGMGVFWQIKAIVTSTTGTEIIDYPTNFATLGWLWNYEQNGQDITQITKYGSLGFPKPVVKWFNPNVPMYFKQDFVLGRAIEDTTSTNMISTTVETKTKTRCTKDSALVVYLDKRGLWDVFSTHGKILVSSKPKSEFSSRVFRDPKRVSNTIAHSTLRNSLLVEQKWTINTGSIDESDVQRVEELTYSPKIYLIKFAGDVVTEITEGITIDSTFVTIDDTDITIDNTPIVPTMVPYFQTFQQIPVTIEDADFIRKTLMNDKSQIDYTLTLNETNNKINSIR